MNNSVNDAVTLDSNINDNNTPIAETINSDAAAPIDNTIDNSVMKSNNQDNNANEKDIDEHNRDIYPTCDINEETGSDSIEDSTNINSNCTGRIA